MYLADVIIYQKIPGNLEGGIKSSCIVTYMYDDPK